MNFQEQIGNDVFVFLRTPLVLEENQPLNSLGGTLRGVEPSGIWIQSKTIDKRFERSVWDLELKQGGTDAVGTVSLVCFVPFSQIRFAIGFTAKAEEVL